MNTKTSMYRTAAIFLIAMILFAALPVAPAGAVSLDITSVATGTWEATAWPDTQRSGTISVLLGSTTVTGTGTAFLTELSVGNIIKTTTGTQIGTVASITDDTSLTLVNPANPARTNIAYKVQGVGPVDNVTIATGHTVAIAAQPVNQAGTVTVNAGGTLTVSNPATVFSTLTVDGTLTGMDDIAFGVLTVNNGGVVNAVGNGIYTASSLTINSGGTVNASRDFTVNGASSITGTINFNSTSVTARSMVFAGSVTLNSGAIWTEPASGNNGDNNTYDFQNDFTNNASTFTTSDTSIHTFSGTGRMISGGTNTSIARVIVTGTYTNNGILTVGTDLSGTGVLTNGSAGTLNLGGASSIATLSNAGIATKTGAGPISTTLANFTNTGTLNLNGTGTITGITNNAGGTVNLASSGSIAAFNNATATSTLNISDLTPPTITTFTVSVPGNTVNYNGAGTQTVKSMTYSNLIFSGSGAKSITMSGGSTLTNGNLSIAPTGTATASITGPNLVVNSLRLGGFGKTSGTWGSSSSVATNKNDTYFALTAGYLNVTTDTRLSQTINFTSTAPANAAVGGATYTPTATAASGLLVTFSIDAAASSVCSISAGVVSFDATGTCVINANQAGDANYFAAPQVQQSFIVKTNQTISFTSAAPVNAVVGGATYTPTATATSGLPVTFTIDATASSVCSISAGAVSFNAAGTCVINADQAGDAIYFAAPQVQQSFAVGKGAQTISFTSTAPTNATVGGAYTPTAAATSGLPVTFTIDATASSVCSISGGVVSFNAAGTCVINADQAGDANYLAAPQVQQSFAVADLPKGGSGSDTTGVFRPINGIIFLKNSNTTGIADVGLNYGIPGDYPVVGDWDGNGTATIGVYRNGSFYLRNSNTVGFAEMVFPFGQPGDQPIAGDWDGDGVDTIGVYRPSTGQFLMRNSNDAGAAEMSFYLGNVGDVGIAGDWDGDGKDTTGVFRPVNGIIFLKNTNETGFADVALNYGIPGDKPVTGDWDNDGIDTIGVYRNGQFMLRNSNTVGFADIVFGLGNPGDMPIAGNWDGIP